MPEVRRGSLQIQTNSAVSSSSKTVVIGDTNNSASNNIDKPSSNNDTPASPAAAAAATSSSALGDKPPVTPTSPISPTPPVAPSSPQRLRVSIAPSARGRSVDLRRSEQISRPPRRHSDSGQDNQGAPRVSLSYAQRPDAEVYYDSRAGSRREWRRRAITLEEYYEERPELLPQLPFTWHHGWKRWKLFIFAFLVFVDASAIPIALYYGMAYAGDVAGWIIFAVVTSIWGGPTYVEFAVRTLRLMRKERFFRPLGTNSRWCFDMLTWASVLTIATVTALFIIGSAPHNVWLRVLCMPVPAILYCLGGVLAMITLYHYMNWPAPFRISSTGKGEKVLPGVYYFIEDVVAVNAGAGRPFREALAARYKASPRFRRMLFIQSIFWSFPALGLAVGLTVIAVIPPVPATAAYGVCWAVPFLWAALWAYISIKWCKRDMVRERIEWQTGADLEKVAAEAEAPSVGP